MHIERDQLQELTEIMEDSLAQACDDNVMSGELAWKIVSALAEAKIAELNGVI